MPCSPTTAASSAAASTVTPTSCFCSSKTSSTSEPGQPATIQWHSRALAPHPCSTSISASRAVAPGSRPLSRCRPLLISISLNTIPNDRIRAAARTATSQSPPSSTASEGRIRHRQTRSRKPPNPCPPRRLLSADYPLCTDCSFANPCQSSFSTCSEPATTRSVYHGLIRDEGE